MPRRHEPCPMPLDEHCDWRGPETQLLTHVAERHMPGFADRRGLPRSTVMRWAGDLAGDATHLLHAKRIMAHDHLVAQMLQDEADRLKAFSEAITDAAHRQWRAEMVHAATR